MLDNHSPNLLEEQCGTSQPHWRFRADSSCLLFFPEASSESPVFSYVVSSEVESRIRALVVGGQAVIDVAILGESVPVRLQLHHRNAMTQAGTAVLANAPDRTTWRSPTLTLVKN